MKRNMPFNNLIPYFRKTNRKLKADLQFSKVKWNSGRDDVREKYGVKC